MAFSSESLLTYLIFNFLFQLLWALANINILTPKALVSIFLHAYPIRLEGFSSILLPRYKQGTESTYSPPKKMLPCSRVVGDKLMKMGFCLCCPAQNCLLRLGLDWPSGSIRMWCSEKVFLDNPSTWVWIPDKNSLDFEGSYYGHQTQKNSLFGLVGSPN